MKAILEFDLNEPDEEQAHKRAVKSTDAYLALWTTGQEVFRPHRKHGYNDPKIMQWLEHPDEQISNATYEVIERLEEMYYEILHKYSINLDEELS